MPATTRTTTRSGNVNTQRNVYRHIISYADDILITTTNGEEVHELLARAKTSLQKAGLSISLEKTQIIFFNNNDKAKFDYMGFT